MTNNPILDELRLVREKLLADAGGSIDALVDRLQEEEKNSDRPKFARRNDASRDSESNEMSR